MDQEKRIVRGMRGRLFSVEGNVKLVWRGVSSSSKGEGPFAFNVHRWW